MRDFIINNLIDVRNNKKKIFDYQYKSDDGDIISMNGTIKYGKADFIIERIKANGHKCSAVPVYQMLLTDNMIVEIAEIAVEAL